MQVAEDLERRARAIHCEQLHNTFVRDRMACQRAIDHTRVQLGIETSTRSPSQLERTQKTCPYRRNCRIACRIRYVREQRLDKLRGHRQNSRQSMQNRQNAVRVHVSIAACTMVDTDGRTHSRLSNVEYRVQYVCYPRFPLLLAYNTIVFPHHYPWPPWSSA